MSLRPRYRVLFGLLGLLLAFPVQAFTLETVIRGVEGDLGKNLRASLSLVAEADDPRLTPARLRQLARLARREAARALQPFGYYTPRVEVKLERRDENSWRAVVEVEKGPPVRVRSVDYRIEGEGAEDALFPREFPLQSGEVLQHGPWEAFKRELLELALMNGYLDARLSWSRILVDPGAHSADLELVLETGPLYHVGKVTIRQDFLDPGLAHRLVGELEGERYTQQRILSVQRTLLDTNYFRLVEVEPRRERRKEGSIPVEITLEPRDRDQYRVGVGYATDEGPRLTLQWNRRLFNRRGHSAGLRLRFSPVESTFSGSYRIPGTDPRTDYLAFEPGLEYHDSKGRTGHTATLGLVHYSLRGGWQRLLGLEYTEERNELDGGKRERFHELVPSLQLTRRSQDDPLRTLEGYRVDFKVLGALEPLLSSGTYLQGRAFGKWIHSRGGDWRLVARAEVGLTWAGALGDVPASRRFYAGGDNSVRGYRYESLAPRDDQGRILGGRHLGVASLELDRLLGEKWAISLFVDGGGASDPGHRNRTAVGAGFGGIWFSPVGPVRVDLGFPVDDPEENGPRLHVSVGPEL